jgi:hypothetical protein
MYRTGAPRPFTTRTQPHFPPERNPARGYFAEVEADPIAYT